MQPDRDEQPRVRRVKIEPIRAGVTDEYRAILNVIASGSLGFPCEVAGFNGPKWVVRPLLGATIPPAIAAQIQAAKNGGRHG